LSSQADLRLDVKVVPRASRTEMAGWYGDRLRVRVAAVPEGGRANAELIAFLAAALSIHRRDIAIRSGHGSTLKTIEIRGLDQASLAAALPPKDGR
jgi:uncharacterized protein